MWRRCLTGPLILLLLSGAATGNQGTAFADAERRLTPAGPEVEAGQFERPSGANWAEMQRRYKGAFVLSAPKPSRRQVALTFDDVPDSRYTPLILNVLKQQNVKATFFVVGSRALKQPGLVRRIHAEGHAIGNHSFDHPDFSKLGIVGMKKQIRTTESALIRSVGFAPRLIRPPYGEIRMSQLNWAQSQGYTVVNWDVDSSDWRQLNAQVVYRNVTSSVRPGSIILLHAGGGAGQNLYGTVNALPKLILWLRTHRYEPVTLPELLQLPERKND
ncbi:polysaccharide deacetylase family protein [Cohnella thailandensis]|uniref:Polysaccharide deacetylase family protein n=2 Tax=Cohnella thailandensis TaxID=557557 RepID=A0A841SPY8_9BACL|nr:polysaccharide deacetylase family protein [Cohnella thailandensis]